MAVHTHDFTHLDALAHVGYDGLLYNGVDASTVQDKGAPTNSIAAVGAVVSRAILADVAKLEQVQSLPPGFVITPQHLDSALDAAGVEPRRGDVLLVRTGWISQYLDDRHVAAQGWPGLGTATVDWLFEHEVCAVGADNLAVEVKPFEDEEKSFLVHEHFIRDMGGYLIEFLDLEKLAEDEVYESLFVLAPLRLEGGLGSPVTPVAIG